MPMNSIILLQALLHTLQPGTRLAMFRATAPISLAEQRALAAGAAGMAAAPVVLSTLTAHSGRSRSCPPPGEVRGRERP